MDEYKQNSKEDLNNKKFLILVQGCTNFFSIKIIVCIFKSHATRILSVITTLR